MSDDENEYSDWFSRLNTGIQSRIFYVVGIVGFILFSPLLLFKGITINRIMGWFTRASNIAFRGLPILFLPFFALHEALHILFMAIALFHPKITFVKWLMPKFHTPESFTMGMKIDVPEDNERSRTVTILVMLICIAPILGFIPAIWAIKHTTNPYIMTYLIFGSLWCIPSDGDRMIIKDGIAQLHKK